MKKSKSAKSEEKAIHFRLCHFCLHLNESVETILGCTNCGQFYTTDVDDTPDDQSLDEEVSVESSYRERNVKGLVTITGLSGLF